MNKQTSIQPDQGRPPAPTQRRRDVGEAPPTGDKPEPEFLSLAEAGRLLGVGRRRAWELAHAGSLPAIRLGRRWYVPRRALDALVD
ncbi:MAG TPA: helix-turn-helix domain-containing protein, partial [Chloroflexota bacterium]